MFFKRVEISNFKSFDKLEVDLGKLNVLIGANASGKSNFVQIFKFLRDIVNDGLENAISLQGGVRYLRNTNIDLSNDFSFRTIFRPDDSFTLVMDSRKSLIEFRPKEIIYEFTIQFKKTIQTFDVLNDHLVSEGDFIQLEERENLLGTGKMDYFATKGQIHQYHLEVSDNPILAQEQISPKILTFPFREGVPSKKLMLEADLAVPISPLLKAPLLQTSGNISIYDFNPSKMKQAVPIAGKRELEEDGGNISLVLKNLLQSKTKRERFLNLLQDMLPFVKNLKTSTFADKSLHFSLKENFLKAQDFPASFLSDGTVNLIALIIALFFEERDESENNLIIIEEPEKHVHPSLISKMMTLFKEASEKNQIIITTHNPEIVKHTDLENLLLIARGPDGHSVITRPAEKYEVKTFLENEIGIEDLFVQDLLGA